MLGREDHTTQALLKSNPHYIYHLHYYLSSTQSHRKVSPALLLYISTPHHRPHHPHPPPSSPSHASPWPSAQPAGGESLMSHQTSSSPPPHPSTCTITSQNTIMQPSSHKIPLGGRKHSSLCGHVVRLRCALFGIRGFEEDFERRQEEVALVASVIVFQTTLAVLQY